MTDLGETFEELGLSQYLDVFLEQGFDTWDTILDITESDFDALGVKLGHRRKLQRRIANSRGPSKLSTESAAPSPKRSALSVDQQAESPKDGSVKGESKETSTTSTTGKRKYRRHPKPDENAPERPPSAYVIFSNKMREDLKGRNLSFTEIAKLVGENWQSLSSAEKEPFEHQALTAKEKYNAALAEYKKTDSYKKYAEYLVEFKAKHSNQQPGTAQKPSEFAMPYPKLTDSAANLVKRPKLENNGSNSSSTDSSQHEQNAGHSRSGSIGSWQHVSEYTAGPISYMPGYPMPSTAGFMPHATQSSPAASVSGTALPGYRDIVIGSQQQMPWREMNGDSVNRYSNRRPSTSGYPQSQADSPNYGLNHLALSHRSVTSTPPLLKSESTGTSSESYGSSHYGPRTPVEPVLDRSSLPPYNSKLSGIHDAKIPSLRPSLSPQISINTSQISLNGTIPPVNNRVGAPMMTAGGSASEISQINARRGFLPPPHPSLSTIDNTRRGQAPVHEEALDPVSALLKAGEIVNSGNRNGYRN